MFRGSRALSSVVAACFLAFVILSVIVVLFSTDSPISVPGVVKIDSVSDGAVTLVVEGQVSTYQAGSQDLSSIRLVKGDILRCGPGTIVELAIVPSGHRVKLGANANLTIIALRRGYETVVAIDGGKLVATVGELKKGESFIVRGRFGQVSAQEGKFSFVTERGSVSNEIYEGIGCISGTLTAKHIIAPDAAGIQLKSGEAVEIEGSERRAAAAPHAVPSMPAIKKTTISTTLGDF